MTREESKSFLIDISYKLGNMAIEYLTEKDGEKMREAIKALEQEPTTKENLVVEDCISRKAVLDALNKWDWQELYLPVHFKDIIDDLPSIQPKPKTDEPMQVDLEGDGYSDGELVYDYGKCPKCGWQFEYGEKDWEEPYCCHCGQRLHWFESEDKE